MALRPTYDLSTQYDSRKSFGGKARVRPMVNGDIDLISYETRVATVTADGRAIVFGTYSATTLRHIKEFLLQRGFVADSKAQIVRDYLED